MSSMPGATRPWPAFMSFGGSTNHTKKKRKKTPTYGGPATRKLGKSPMRGKTGLSDIQERPTTVARGGKCVPSNTHDIVGQTLVVGKHDIRNSG